ncbi:hypothetical protein BGW80DRAFT_796604 [Lactifluus volemus]|nr:hypothetical protein BGW80DRAFT_796604 [Lactifluus volemus]
MPISCEKCVEYALQRGLMFLPGSSTVGDRRYDVWTESVDPAFDIYRILDTTIAGVTSA